MIVILYLILIVILLVLLKNLFFSHENFHIPSENVNSLENTETEEHEHTTQTPLEQAVQGIPPQVQNIPETTTSTTSTSNNDASAGPVVPQSQNSSVSAPAPAPFDPNNPQQAQQAQQPQQATNLQTVIPVVSTAEAATILQNIAAAQAENIVSVTTPVDDKCCGINIYENKLENINKCIIQHIKNNGNRLDPQYNEWKEVDDEENKCQSPQNILAKTSNCYDIVNKYKKNINSLLCISNENTKNCSYNHKSSIRLPGAQLSDKEKMAIFIGNIACEDNGSYELDEYPNGSNYFIKKCN